MKIFKPMVICLVLTGFGVASTAPEAHALFTRKLFKKMKEKREQRKAEGKKGIFGKMKERIKNRRADRKAARDQCSDQKGFAKFRCVNQTAKSLRQDRRAGNPQGPFAKRFGGGAAMLGRGIQNGNITAEEQTHLQTLKTQHQTQRQDLRQQYMADGQMSAEERQAYRQQMRTNRRDYRQQLRGYYRSPAGTNAMGTQAPHQTPADPAAGAPAGGQNSGG